MIRYFLSFALIAVAPALCLAADLPAAVADLQRPLPEPYRVEADAHADIAAAIARAKASGKRVLVDFGGNWCTDCRVLAGVAALPAAAAKLNARFEFVTVDVGRYNKNMDIPESYGMKIKGVPSLVVLDGNGRVVPDGVITSLTDARGMTPESILDSLMQHAGS